MLYPLTFQPVLQERIWGGRNLQRLYHKALPPDSPFGESWEITDRPEGVSVIANGSLAGRDLRWLMEHHREALLGPVPAPHGRFPVLVKILDARDVLSVQVHPPASIAPRWSGEPKSEMWFVTEAAPDAVLYAGLKRGVDRALFEESVRSGRAAECLHRIPVQSGDAMFLPSGRVHAIGAGIVIFEIQQNSDTTFRVFDWNRLGLDGKPRELHVDASLDCINFEDHEPGLIHSRYSRNANLKVRFLVDDPHFLVDACQAKRGLRFHVGLRTPQIFGLIKGKLEMVGGGETVVLEPGMFCLAPAALGRVTITALHQSEYLHIQLGMGSVGPGI